jgi:hypothetical protein
VAGGGWEGGGGICSEIMYVRFDRAPVSQTDVVYNNDNDNGLVLFLINLDSSNLCIEAP